MEWIWKALGHRPSRIEWQAANPYVSSNTVKRRFGGWTNACMRFIEYKMGKDIAVVGVSESRSNNDAKSSQVVPMWENIRSISLKLMLDVLKL